MKIANNHYAIEIDASSGAISSLFVKSLNCDLISENRLRANFRLLLPLQDCEAHYIDGLRQQTPSIRQEGPKVTVCFDKLQSDRGTFDVSLTYTVALEDEAVIFRASLTNRERQPVAELWFPQIGGMKDLAGRRDGHLSSPGYLSCENYKVFTKMPIGSFAEPAEWSLHYPGLMLMPWWELYEPTNDVGVYLGYHDVTCRYSTWHLHLHPTVSGRATDSWLTPAETGGQPIGLVFSHVRYPYIHSGETYETGEFVLRAHKGDWHAGAKHYRRWFDRHWKVDGTHSWLRQKSAWFTSILQTPEDRIVADYATYDQWCQDAQQYGISCYELIGWANGGLERGYPYYVPAEKLGGRAAFRQLLQSIDSRAGKCLVFANYNVLDSNSEEYRTKLREWTHQDLLGTTPNWMSWGYSTLSARRTLTSRRHVLSSILPELEELLGDQFEQLVRDGAHGLQLDKVCVNARLDFNPRNTWKPDEALSEGLVAAIGRLHQRLKAINPEFCLASEAAHDRLIPFVDVFYRAQQGFSISPLRYVFPEWTACVHISAPRDFNGVNGAVLTGGVICVEPEMYRSTLANPLWHEMARYIQEIERLRHDLADIIFLANYFDTFDASVTVVGGEKVEYRVHGHRETDRRALVIANPTAGEIEYRWKFLHKDLAHADLYAPFQPVLTVRQGDSLRIQPERVQILVEPA
ncbi:MAG: hypothetical protein PCFJNLEI_01893 [Verrucomicrobiae bacterium]|nr:hypothetical protein [Verrucomicrobiae bacterium]